MSDSAPASPTFYDAVTRLQELALADSAILYAINIRNAGWGIMFYEAARDPERKAITGEWKHEGLVTYHYYPELRQAIEAETARLEAKAAEWAALAPASGGQTSD